MRLTMVGWRSENFVSVLANQARRLIDQALGLFFEVTPKCIVGRLDQTLGCPTLLSVLVIDQTNKLGQPTSSFVLSPCRPVCFIS